MRFHEVPWDSMRFYDVPVNQSVPTEANRSLTSYTTGALVHAGSGGDCTATRIQEFSERPGWYRDN
jgi:hypothetical protein